jgi:uncharacterized protein YqfA (UPF0365 family)
MAQITSLFWWAGLALLGLLAVVALALLLRFGNLWLQAIASGARVSLARLLAMSLRQIDVKQIIRARIMGAQAGLWAREGGDRPTGLLEAHYLANGNVMRVMQAIIAAQRAGIDLDFDRAAAIDLAGRDVLEAVQTSVYPKVIDCPDPTYLGKAFLSAVSRDGIELRVHARVTVRTKPSWSEAPPNRRLSRVLAKGSSKPSAKQRRTISSWKGRIGSPKRS